ncbi:radical SAM/SPASM domain-containing protein [Tardiphaga sp. 839_C3_N1_4]|jgi:radical SAM protein with 4Fe4S-binding SPASM domain|uniref:radical SAM/SPASM domain-containing protein n=1 Tax=Tardiphaga sp. 839_C3_N1_4 TaxID=3240761 RepID=UPI003F25F38B
MSIFKEFLRRVREGKNSAIDVEGLLADFRISHSSLNDRGIIVHGPIGPSRVYLAAIGQTRLPSNTSLLSLVQAAEKLGFAIAPQSDDFGELVAVTEATKLSLNSAPDRWVEKLLGNSPKEYLAALHPMIREISPIIEEQMVATLHKTAYPKNFVFEFANVCNLACPICPRHHRAIPDALMSLASAKDVIRDLAEVNEELTLYPYYLGETLIHPDFIELVDFILEFPNIQLNIVSNGILLDKKISEKLLSRKIKSYHFSLHDCDTALHEGVHPRHAISARNVLDFLKMAEPIRTNIWVGVSMVPIQLDERAVEEFREFWQPVVNAVNIYAYLTPERRISDPAIEEAFSGFFLPCSSPWVQPVISVDGTVLPCCWDYEHTMKMGNVFEKPFKEIYEGAPFRELRQASLDKNLDQFPTCASCSKWIDYLPSFRPVDMEHFMFQSTGTYLSFQTKDIQPHIVHERQRELQIEGNGRQHLPIHRAGRPQARRGFLR